jgi:hypothetical protein
LKLHDLVRAVHRVLHRVSESPEAASEAKPPELGQDAVLRRIPRDPNMLYTDLVTGEIRPSSGAFKPDSDGVSVFREGVLEAALLEPSAIMRRHDDLVARLLVSDVRALTLDVVDDPWPGDVDDPANRCYVAHALIVGWNGLGKKRRVKLQRELAQHPNLVSVYG